MNILVIDRDALNCQLVKSKLESLGHNVTVEPAKNHAVELISNDDFDAVLFDPAPLSSPVPFLLSLRKSLMGECLPYIALMSHETDLDAAISAGTNDVLGKPLDIMDLEAKLKNAERLTRLSERLNDEEDFAGSGRVLSKTAFSQLFMAALDRAGRYGEQTYFIFITLNNYDDLLERHGNDAAENAIEDLQNLLARLRRQSDVLARSGKQEFCLMLQRPRYESEPFDAARRFRKALVTFKEDEMDPKAEIGLFMLDVPAGTLHFNRRI